MHALFCYSTFISIFSFTHPLIVSSLSQRILATFSIESPSLKREFAILRFSSSRPIFIPSFFPASYSAFLSFLFSSSSFYSNILIATTSARFFCRNSLRIPSGTLSLTARSTAVFSSISLEYLRTLSTY